MSESIDTTGDIFKKAVSSKVYLADKPGTTWEEEPLLYLNRIRFATGPDIDEANFVYHYGDFAVGEGERSAGLNLILSDLNRKYVKVELIRENAQLQPEVFKTWYGIIDIDAKDVMGTRPGATGVPTGDQGITAYGLMRDLELQTIQTSQVEVAGSTPGEIKRGLPFNIFDAVQFGRLLHLGQHVPKLGTRNPIFDRLCHVANQPRREEVRSPRVHHERGLLVRLVRGELRSSAGGQ